MDVSCICVHSSHRLIYYFPCQLLHAFCPQLYLKEKSERNGLAGKFQCAVELLLMDLEEAISMCPVKCLRPRPRGTTSGDCHNTVSAVGLVSVVIE